MKVKQKSLPEFPIHKTGNGRKQAGSKLQRIIKNSLLGLSIGGFLAAPSTAQETKKGAKAHKPKAQMEFEVITDPREIEALDRSIPKAPIQSELAKALNYKGLQRDTKVFKVLKRDVAMEIIDEIATKKEWKLRCETAPVIEDSDPGYILDIRDFATDVAIVQDPEIKEKYQSTPYTRRMEKYNMQDIVDFGKEIKSGRIASMLLAAEAAGLKREVGEGLSLLELAGTINNIFTRKGYFTKDPDLLRAKQKLENDIITLIYGSNENSTLLIDAFETDKTVDLSNPKKPVYKETRASDGRKKFQEALEREKNN